MNDTSAPSMSSSGRRTPSLTAVMGVGVVAALARLAVAFAARESGLWADMIDYHDRATLLAGGDSLHDSYRGPGYPLFLALLYALPGADLWAARVGNALLGGVTAVMTAYLASGFVGTRAALGAALVVALYPASVLSTVYLMPEPLYGALLLAAVVTTCHVLSPRRAITAGVLSAAAALTRSLGAVLSLAVVVGHLPRFGDPVRWRAFAGRVGLLVAASLVTLTPWLVHTWKVSGGLMLDSNSGFNVLLGANPDARERLELTSYGEYFQTYVLGMPDEADRNRQTLRRSWEWIRENPWTWLRLMPRKAAYLYGIEGREHVWLYSHSYFGPRRTATVWIWAILLVVCFPPLAALAAIGLMRPGLLAIPAGAQVLALLLLTTVLHAVSFGETRFHLPLVPFLAVLAARGLHGEPRLTWRRTLVGVAIIAGLAAGWWNQWPEIAEQVARITAPEGWKSALPY